MLAVVPTYNNKHQRGISGSCSRECALGESRQNSTYESRRNITCLALEYVLLHVFMVTRANIIFGCIWHIFFKMCSW